MVIVAILGKKDEREKVIKYVISKYGENYSVTPDKYFAEKFCWVTSKKETNQQFEQMVLPLESMR